jgi:glycosyltransferase involved in cell wall biosynthesis
VINSMFHRTVWQRLPRRIRRELAFGISRLLAPAPSASAQGTEPIVVAGVFRAATGLGESARLCRLAAARAGFATRAVDLTKAMMQPVDLSEEGYDRPEATHGAGTLILHVNAPMIPLALRALGAKAILHKRIIGFWAWELPRVPSEWRHGLPFVHEIWVPSAFTAAAVAPLAGDRPVRVVHHPVAARAASTLASRRAVGAPFTVLSVFNIASSFARKNPLGAIQAFRRAFGTDPSARLILKASNPDHFPDGLAILSKAVAGAPNIDVDLRALPAAELDALYAGADVVLGLHRSECFGLAAAEAMLRGLPVVGTDWSGTVDFMNALNSMPISFELVPARDPQHEYDDATQRWAEPDVDQAAGALRALRDSPDLRRSLGDRAQADARALFGVERYRAALAASMST